MTSHGPLQDVWYSRDFPVLIELTRRFDEGASQVRPDALTAALDMTEDEVQAALKALVRRRLIDALQTKSWGGPQPVVSISNVAGEAYVMTGLHPGDDAVQALVDAFRQAADQTNDPAEKSRLQQIGDAVKDVSSEVTKSVLAAYIAAHIPG